MNERRAEPRVTPEKGHAIKLQIVANTFLEVVHVRDISTLGIGIHVPHGFEGYELPPEVDLVITLPGNPPFMAKGAIRHTQHTEGTGFFGVVFTEITEKAQEEVRAYVETRLSQK